MDAKEIADAIFRAYDIRGVFGETLTEEAAERIGKTLGTFMQGKGTVVVGHDTRGSSPKTMHAFLKGLTQTGTSAVVIGALPNPLCYFYTWKNGYDAGCYITASHNPAEYNGFKFIRKDGVSFVEELDKLKELFIKGEFREGKGSVEEKKDALVQYKEFWKQRVKIGSKVKIVCDSFFGAATTIVPQVFEEFSIECTARRNKRLPDLGGTRPEPNTETVKPLGEQVTKEGADFGVAFDGDADRSMFVDEEGRSIIGGVMLILFAKHMAGEGDRVVATIDCPSEIKNIGPKALWCRTGHGFIEEMVQKEGAVFGGEQSSHFFPGKYYPFSDGIASTLLLAQIMSKSKKKLSEMVKELKVMPSEKIYIHAHTHKIKDKVVENLKERLIKENPEKENDTHDGIKMFLNEKEWVLIRVSNNVPEVNLALQAKDEERLKELMHKYSEMIKKEIESVKSND